MSSTSIDVEVAIVGSGFSGLAMGIQLKKAGIESFRILEKAQDVGGTWRENTYPGAACDIPSHLYSFSFEPNPSWSRSYSPQPEILEYLRHCARKYGMLPHIQFGAEVIGAEHDVASGTWLVRTRDGATLRARALVLGNGGLHVPSYPDIPGRETFEGTTFHSACWNHDYDLRGKRVAVIGTGASAIQFVPRIAPDVASMHVFQRTAPWIVPKADRAFRARTKALLSRSRTLQRALRAAIYVQHEARALGFVVEPRILKLAEVLARRHLEASIPDDALRAKLTPDYRMGCKRILPTNEWYPALLRENVEVVTDRIDSITPRGVRTKDGVTREVDAILYGTGFAVADYLATIPVRGTSGATLSEVWKGAPEAYLGITVSGFPNLFLLMGPNTGLGHNSMVFMIEAQARYAAQCIEALRARRLRTLDVRAGVQAEFNERLQHDLAGTIWASGCNSWYLAAAGGRNSLTWPGFTFDYWRRTRRVELADYTLTP
ncbi:MAG: NAD(P)/FAD-dependent oxidoreductase [Myxococcota bacterium]|nr:NAD(P)/FAD-dependent oxidoreductase [Myxococcota bacterium]